MHSGEKSIQGHVDHPINLAVRRTGRSVVLGVRGAVSRCVVRMIGDGEGGAEPERAACWFIEADPAPTGVDRFAFSLNGDYPGARAGSGWPTGIRSL